MVEHLKGWSKEECIVEVGEINCGIESRGLTTEQNLKVGYHQVFKEGMIRI